jgi:hypothetical protein
MLLTVLNSERAIQVNIEIMRAFVRLREMIATHKDLARKPGALERRYDAQSKVSSMGPGTYGAARVKEAQDRVSGKGTRSAVRKRRSVTSMFPEFRKRGISFDRVVGTSEKLE